LKKGNALCNKEKKKKKTVQHPVPRFHRLPPFHPGGKSLQVSRLTDDPKGGEKKGKEKKAGKGGAPLIF